MPVLAVAWGCQEPTQTVSPRAPTKFGIRPSFDLSTTPLPEDGFLKVCSDTPPGTHGTFQFDVHVFYPFPYKPDYDLSTQIHDAECQTLINVGVDPLIKFVQNVEGTDINWKLASVTAVSDDDNGGQGPFVASDWTRNCQPDGTGCGIGQVAGSDIATKTDPIRCWIDPWHGCILTTHNEQILPGATTIKTNLSYTEGRLRIPANTWFAGGYTFKFVNKTHGATQLTVRSRVQVAVTCPSGGGPGGTITVPLGTVTYNIPAGNTDWTLTGHINDPDSWDAAVRTQDLCGGFLMDNQVGAVFSAAVLQSPATGSPIDFKFKYRDPASKGKPDTNCDDMDDPNRNLTNVCSSGWSVPTRAQ